MAVTDALSAAGGLQALGLSNPATIGIGAGLSFLEGLWNMGSKKAAMDYLDSMPIPPAEKYQYKAMLIEDPALFHREVIKQSAMEGITEDPRLRSAQMQALDQLQQRGESGYTVGERADIEALMNDVLTRNRGAQEALQQQYARRGLLGSGLQYGAQQSQNQAALQNASQRGFDVAKAGQQRALQAMAQAGQLGGQVRGQEFGQKAQVASARDALNQFNINQLNDAQRARLQAAMANQQATNQANQFNNQMTFNRDQMQEQRNVMQAQNQTPFDLFR